MPKARTNEEECLSGIDMFNHLLWKQACADIGLNLSCGSNVLVCDSDGSYVIGWYQYLLKEGSADSMSSIAKMGYSDAKGKYEGYLNDRGEYVR